VGVAAVLGTGGQSAYAVAFIEGDVFDAHFSVIVIAFGFVEFCSEVLDGGGLRVLECR
jgi:hypothetical protein